MTTTSTPLWDVVIVGGGAAGLSAALVLSRARRSVLVLDGGEPRNRFAPHMHGVLSRDGYSPLQMLEDGRREVRAVDGVIETAQVSTITRLEQGFAVTTDTGAQMHARRVIIATGVRDELPDIPGLADQWGRGVVACPYCDGYEARGKRIGVMVGSPMGLHKAQMIRAYSETVTVFPATSISAQEMRALDARGIRVEERAIVRVAETGGSLSGVEFADGSNMELDVLFADGRLVANDELLRQLGAGQSDTFVGAWTATDAMFQTSVPGVFAIGNTANPAALVPLAMGAGVTAATAINAELVGEDIAAALAGAAPSHGDPAHGHPAHGDPALGDHGHGSPSHGDHAQGSPSHADIDPNLSPAEYWENRYRENGRNWSGNVNAALEREVSGVAPGTALDLGCGEGGDALWLAHQGWSVTAVDISPTALAVGAAEQRPEDDVTWIAADLSDWEPPIRYDLVSACFLHSLVELPREEILRRAASAVAPGGLLVVVGHQGAPSWVQDAPDGLVLPGPDEVHAQLRLAPEDWVVVTKASISRATTAPDGTTGSILDSVLTLRRV